MSQGSLTVAMPEAGDFVEITPTLLWGVGQSLSFAHRMERLNQLLDTFDYAYITDSAVSLQMTEHGNS
jgi:hypothetical protein